MEWGWRGPVKARECGMLEINTWLVCKGRWKRIKSLCEQGLKFMVEFGCLGNIVVVQDSLLSVRITHSMSKNNILVLKGTKSFLKNNILLFRSTVNGKVNVKGSSQGEKQ